MTRALSGEPLVQWYPGHMVKAMRRLADDVRHADIVIEAIDARVPHAGANPALAELAKHKRHVLVLTREDLADKHATAAWLERLRTDDREAIAVDAKARGGTARLVATLGSAKARATGRAIVVGIPNAGKSTLINALVGRVVARAEDRAGVTRSPQWFRIAAGIEVMDTAGILVPKIEGPEAQWKLAVVGAVPRSRFDPEEVASRFAAWAPAHGIGAPDLETFAQQRGFIRRGNVIDMHNAAWSYLKVLGDGGFGRITLEDPAP